MKRESSRTLHTLATPLLGALASFTLHALLLTPALIGAWGHETRHPQPQPSGFGNQSSSDDDSLTVTFIDEIGGAATGSTGPVASAMELASPKTFLIPIALADMPLARVLTLSDTQLDLAAAGDGGESDPGRVLMFGRYVGQISARIERAWIKPRAPISGGQFACRARILQNTDGRVQEIELEGCNGDPAWQISLVRAIESASPLPAPPDLSVFARTLRIQFKADPFVTGGSPEGFESESRTARN